MDNPHGIIDPNNVLTVDLMEVYYTYIYISFFLLLDCIQNDIEVFLKELELSNVRKKISR